MMSRKILAAIATALVLAFIDRASAGQAKLYRVGVIHQGGSYTAVVDGFREGLRQLGFEEGRQIVLEIRDTKGDLKAVQEAARSLQRGRVDLLYAVATSGRHRG